MGMVNGLRNDKGYVCFIQRYPTKRLMLELGDLWHGVLLGDQLSGPDIYRDNYKLSA